MAERETGTVTYFNSSRGFGFIERDNGRELYVHRSGIRGEGFKTLYERERVEYEIVPATKGFQAWDVVVVGEDPRFETRGERGGDGRSGERETGTVKWFSASKGYGFIQRSNGEDVFIHYSGVRGEGFRRLLEGDHVEFKVVQGPKGLRAEDAVLV